MRVPVDAERPLKVIASIGSTQDEAVRILHGQEPYGAVLAHEQTGGRGRHGRRWISRAGDSLAVSLIFRDYKDHPTPWLPGMAVAIAAAQAGAVRLRWPNDLFWEGRKVGGILTEVVDGVPIVGLGVNLNQTAFPAEIADLATSLLLASGGSFTLEGFFSRFLDKLASLPEPDAWSDLAPYWRPLDRTPGKIYRLPDGRETVAEGVDPAGRLVTEFEGEKLVVTVAEAIFGRA
ncbi:biotin--[acetyl-CoA-carboxylase] ligase [bacterium]|nr:MAG: biotin--[acetyl-CoA-carboxylase] ligase [bacterium]